MARIAVLAGTNGAGKSSIAGAALRGAGGTYFNPDEVTQDIRTARSDLSAAEANSLAWQQSVHRLREAIAKGTDYTFETTLGGNTVTRLLIQAANEGHELAIWYCGLDSPERHLVRVASRVAKGGHDIPEAKIRARYDASRANLVKLIPHVARLSVYDNSIEADPHTGNQPAPALVLAIAHAKIQFPSLDQLTGTPAWAKPLIAAAYKAWNK